jgi:hypothetical protein
MNYFTWLALLALTGCASAPTIITQTKIITPDVPAYLLVCQPEPPLPAASTQGQIADFMVADDEAGQDCRMRLGAVAAVLAPAGTSAKSGAK